MSLHINWHVYAKLLILSVFGSVAIAPYLQFFIMHLEKRQISLIQIFYNQIAQTAVVIVPTLIIGMMLAKRIGFRMPFLDNWSKNRKKFVPYLKRSVIFGVFTAIVIIAIHYVFNNLGIRPQNIGGITPPLLFRILASFYGGINEEIFFRLFATSFMIWLITKISFKKDYKSKKIIWLGIFIAAIIFGLITGPFNLNLASLDYLLVLRSVVLNGFAGLVYGYMYWRMGLESAMLTHLVTDLFLQVI